jgi:hypothetical protein
MKSKYIIIDLEGLEVPVIFSRFLQHGEVAAAMQNPVRSAGFCELDPTGKWMVGGESLSLNLEAGERDAKILNDHLGTHVSPCQPALAMTCHAKI